MHAELDGKLFKHRQTINANVELSTWTFEDAMAFCEGEAVMA
jgi:hypothetical protein